MKIVLRYPEVQTTVLEPEKKVFVAFQPSVDDHHLSALEERMGYLHGVADVTTHIGSMTLQVANPLFPVSDMAYRVKDTVKAYFLPEEAEAEVKQSVPTFRAERYRDKELHPVDLCIAVNHQLIGSSCITLYKELSESPETEVVANMIYGISLADRGYNLHLRLKPLFSGHGIKDDISTSTISFLVRNQDRGRLFRSPQLHSEWPYNTNPIDFDSAVDLSAWKMKAQ